MKNKKIWVAQKWKTEFVEHDDKLTIDNEFEVIVKNHYTHLSAGTELACLAGLEGWFKIPECPGYTGIGQVIEKGAGVTKVDVGDLVYTYSTHSQYFKLNVTDRWHGVCVKLPEGINPQWASFTHMAGIAMTAIRRSKIELGDFVLVTGQGVIGILAAQLAQLQGARVIVSDINEKRLQVSGQCGLKTLINPQVVDMKETIMEITDGKGVSTFIDASGVPAVIEKAAGCVGWNGEIILLGSPRTPYQTDLSAFLGHFHYIPWNHALKGALEFTLPTFQDDFNKHSIEQNVKTLMWLIKHEKLIIAPFFTHLLHPSQCQQAYEGLRDKGDEFMGVVFDWSKTETSNTN